MSLANYDCLPQESGQAEKLFCKSVYLEEDTDADSGANERNNIVDLSSMNPFMFVSLIKVGLGVREGSPDTSRYISACIYLYSRKLYYRAREKCSRMRT